uniref:Uncharacterized protein n=1 Tax=Arundo donax TaxID=35708 RepID=A0A0A9BJV5_ARUDO
MLSGLELLSCSVDLEHPSRFSEF